MISRRARGTYSDTFAYDATTARERAAAAAVAATLIASPLLLIPFAHLATPPIPTFVASSQTLAVTATLFTASMLYAQFRIRLHAPLAILAAGYALLGVLHALYFLTLPGVFVGRGLLDPNPPTAPWLAAAARIGFAAVVIAYVYVERGARRSARWRMGMAARVSAACVVYAAGCISLATLGRAALAPFFGAAPRLVAIVSAGLVPVAFLVCLGAAAALAVFCGTRRRVHLWLIVVMIAMSVEILAGGLFGGTRFSAGWYLAQIDLAVGSMLFFVVMQSLLASILRRAARNSERARALAEIVALGSDSAGDRIATMLDRAARDLHFSWAGLAELDGADWLSFESSVGDGRYPAGYRAPLAGAWVREALLGRDLVVHGAGVEVPWIDDTPDGPPGWSGFVTVPIFVDDALYGFVAFANVAKRDAPLNEEDLSFLRLVGSLAGATIERLRQRRKLDELAYHDGLTALPNRVLLLDRLQRVLASAVRYERPFAIHFLDLDGFKEVNDRFGHAAGDAVLREVGRRLSNVVRESDTVARLGGDEFVVLQPQLEHARDADRMAARLRASFDEPIAFEHRQLAIGTSIGTSRYPSDGREIQTLMVRADAALYRAKERKRRATSPAEITFVDRLGY
jgi:diguanylate cyclase (GGDEF)-like protein